jgi:hypothetical protein
MGTEEFVFSNFKTLLVLSLAERKKLRIRARG